MNREWKRWKVRYHMNRFEPFPYRDLEVEAFDRAHALTVAAMRTGDWPRETLQHIKRATAWRVK